MNETFSGFHRVHSSFGLLIQFSRYGRFFASKKENPDSSQRVAHAWYFPSQGSSPVFRLGQEVSRLEPNHTRVSNMFSRYHNH